MTVPIPPIAVLPFPAEDDSISDLDVKLSSYLYALHVGNSISAATGQVHAELKRESSERQAIKGMSPSERDFFEAWKERRLLSLPSIDWNADRGHTPTSSRRLKKATRRAEALNRVYGVNGAEPCHYTYFVGKHPLWVPLVTAVGRVVGAERDHPRISTTLEAYKQDFQTVQKIVQLSLLVIGRAEEGQNKTRAQEKLRLFQSYMRSRKQTSEKTLGKRKHSDITTDPDDQGRVESSVARRPKTS